MKKEEFLKTWSKTGGISGLRVIVFDGGSMFANQMEITKEIVDTNGMEYMEKAMFSKIVDNFTTVIGSIRIDKITAVL